MDDDRFWSIIETARAAGVPDSAEFATALRAELIALPADEIVAWDETFDRMTDAAYFVDMWGAAYLINGGASDDGFYYFRCWLVGAGRRIYEAAVRAPDSLAEVVTPNEEYEAEIYSSGFYVWLEVTGLPDTAAYPARSRRLELRGADWDFNDDAEVRQRLPRLALRYLDPPPSKKNR